MLRATKKNRRRKLHKLPTTTATVTSPKIPSKTMSVSPANGIFKAPAEKPWFVPSIKESDRVRPPPAPAAYNRVPVIKIYEVTGFNQLCKLLQEKMKLGDFVFTIRPDRWALDIKQVNDFIWTVKLLDKLRIQYHYKNTLIDKCERYVLRGIPADCELEICKGLGEKGFIVHDVHRLVGPKSSLRAPVFVVYHTPLPEGRRLTEVKSIGRWMVKVELYKGTNREPMLCLRCCRFAHTATFCSVNPRCFKCSALHEGSVCGEVATFKCCNCEGTHPATSKLCPVYQRVKEYNTKAKPPRPDGTPLALLSASQVAVSMAKLALKEQPKHPSDRLKKRIAKSFVMVAWNARGEDAENCPEFMEFLEVQGAQLVCISGSPPLLEDKWSARGWTVLGAEEWAHSGKKRPAAVGPKLLVRKNVVCSRLRTPPLKHMTAVVATVEARGGTSVKVAVAHAGPNDPFASEDVDALFKGTEPTVVFADLCARHPSWASTVRNKRGKALMHAAETGHFSISGPANPARYYYEEEIPSVVLSMRIPRAVTVVPKRLAGSSGRSCPQVVHLRGWRRPRAAEKVELPGELRDLIREKNRLRRLWERSQLWLFKKELNIARAAVQAKLREFRRGQPK